MVYAWYIDHFEFKLLYLVSQTCKFFDRRSEIHDPSKRLMLRFNYKVRERYLLVDSQ